MWPTIDRARRRLTRGASAPGGPSRKADGCRGPSAPASPRRRGRRDHPRSRIEVDQLRAALEHVLGDAVERPDTPARIERALAILLARRGAPGKPSVLRRPAAVSTPESWEIHLDGVDRATSRAVRAAGRTGFFAS